ncbi:MAG: NOL1/NOP2/sun family putative RNA methylase [Candidatus Helarchaeota archaeon]
MENKTLIRKLSKTYGYLEYMIERYFKLFGKEETIKLLKANDSKFFPSIRTNTLKIEPPILKKKLEKKGFRLKQIPWIDYGFWIVKGKLPLGATTEYLLGYYYIQQAASMLPAKILNPNPTDLVIDMCAAPGGKTSHLAQIMRNNGVILAFDINFKRMKSLKSNISRCGIKNTIGYVMDSLKLEEIEISANKVLLDAPCTGEGLICFDSSRKKSRTLNDIKICSIKQEELLRIAIKCTKKGGTIVYSTCSIAPEENEIVINEILRDNSVNIEKTGINFGSEGLIEVFGKKLNPDLRMCKRFYPQTHGTEGFFICKLKKR